MSVKQMVLFLFSLLIFQSAVIAEEASRGQLLYENHCKKCHENDVHFRENRKAKDIIDINKWVIRWQYDQKLNWEYSTIQEVTQYINRSFYKFSERP